MQKPRWRRMQKDVEGRTSRLASLKTMRDRLRPIQESRGNKV
jgi:hypothetical protein